MRYIIFCCLIAPLLLLPNSVFAGAQELFDQANSQYIQKNYSVAIHDYESLLHSYGKEGANAALFYNLGLAYAAADQPGRAILNFERALALTPGDTELITFLANFKKTEGLFTAAPKGIEKITALLGISQWALLGLVSLAFASSLFLASSFLRKRKWLTIINSTLFTFTLLFFAVTIYQWKDAAPFIVVKDGRLLISPIDGADLVLSLREGQKVFPIKRHGHYLYVRNSHNKKGWIAEDAVEAVHSLQFAASPPHQ